MAVFQKLVQYETVEHFLVFFSGLFLILNLPSGIASPGDAQSIAPGYSLAKLLAVLSRL